MSAHEDSCTGTTANTTHTPVIEQRELRVQPDVPHQLLSSCCSEDDVICFPTKCVVGCKTGVCVADVRFVLEQASMNISVACALAFVSIICAYLCVPSSHLTSSGAGPWARPAQSKHVCPDLGGQILLRAHGAWDVRRSTDRHTYSYSHRHSISYSHTNTRREQAKQTNRH